ncbi:MAG: M3 family oligoendopeptidase [Caldilineaceae bacterium]|nr:M3 family oligoendopeptidase [Caldilineaceae bacterium]
MTTTATNYTLSGWDLSELLAEPTDAIVSAQLADIEEEVGTFEGLRSRLEAESQTPDEVHMAVGRYEQIIRKAWSLAYYGHLWFSADTQSTAAMTFQNRVQQALTGIQNRLLFFELWWKGLEDETADRLLPSADTDPDFRFFLEDLRRTRPFTLDEKSEQIINLKDADGMSALMTIYAMLTNRLEFKLTVDGEEQTLTRDALMGYVHSPNPELRAAAYQELYRVYEGEAKVLAQIYNNRVRDWYNEQVELRGYTSPITVRNVANDVPDAAVEALLEVARCNAPVFQRYFRLKAQWLGVEKLRRYDIYAPLAVSDRKVSYADAADLVLDTFQRFDPQVAGLARRVFDENHIDSEVRKGKRGGAFCATVRPEVTPYVLLNYTGKVRDVATLAHELGHGIHGYLAREQGILQASTPITTAEMASTFGEMLVFDYLLQQQTDPAVRFALRMKKMAGTIATAFRQISLNRFEHAMHEARRAQGELSGDQLAGLWLASQRAMFGDSVTITDAYASWWSQITHFITHQGYVYGYAFGELLVWALYARYKQQPAGFADRYLEVLRAGGSDWPHNILAPLGVDLQDPAFWHEGLNLLDQFVADMEADAP